MNRPLCVTFLVRSFGFPEGMAATNRVRLLGRALSEQGVSVRVLCTRVSERPGHVRNRSAAGTADGVAFLYTPGSTTRADSFIERRLRDAKGFIVALRELARLRRMHELDCVYLAALPDGWRPDVWLLLRWLARLDVAVVVEVNELPGEIDWLPRRKGRLPRHPGILPGAMNWVPSSLSRRLSHLAGVDGVVAISAWLAAWANGEAKRIEQHVEIIEVPILVAPDEQWIAPHPPSPEKGAQQASPRTPPTFVYSASSEYSRAVAFILRSMPHVWENHPDCRLTVTGMGPAAVADLADREGLQAASHDGRVTGVGYIDRDSLLRMYRDAAALLIPLFDDLSSRARFPTKIGEYLMSGRPVVATAVGEIERFFCDGETAYVAAPGNPSAFADKLLEILDDPQGAAAVGSAGRALAERTFGYKLQGPRLAAFIEGLARAAADRSAERSHPFRSSPSL